MAAIFALPSHTASHGSCAATPEVNIASASGSSLDSRARDKPPWTDFDLVILKYSGEREDVFEPPLGVHGAPATDLPMTVDSGKRRGSKCGNCASDEALVPIDDIP
jgi:hypothetical protein